MPRWAFPRRVLSFDTTVNATLPMKARLKAGSLLSAIVVSLVILAIIGALMLLGGHRQQLIQRQLRLERLERNLRSAKALALAGMPTADQEVRHLDLFGTGRDSAWIARSAWGIYEACTFGAYQQGDTLWREALLGRAWPVKERFALRLADDDRPLSVSGRTRIIGDAFLPPAGIRKAYIENQSFEGDKVVNGSISDSGHDLPPLNGTVLSRLIAALHTDTLPSGRAVQGLAPGDSIHVSFSSPTQHLFLPDSTILTGMMLSGNLALHCNGVLRVAPSAKLEQVLLFAAGIIVESGFEGSLQAFARDSLVVAKECLLTYPSALGLIPVPDTTDVIEAHPFIQVGAHSTVRGTVFSHSPPKNHLLLSSIFLAEGSKVEGEVYADGYLESRGTVKGSTTCRRFRLRTPSTLYDNFILGAMMDAKGLSPFYLGSMLIHGDGQKNVGRWTH